MMQPEEEQEGDTVFFIGLGEILAFLWDCVSCVRR